MSNSNTRSDFTVTLEYTDQVAGDIINQAVIEELTRRTVATVLTGSSVGDAVVSAVPPDDTTKLWYIADPNGIPTGEAFRYNTSTSQWVTTSVDTPEAICLSSDSSNLITVDSFGCWKVSDEDVQGAVQETLPEISVDSGNLISLGGDGGWFVSPVDVPEISADADNSIVAGGDGGLFVPKLPFISTDSGNQISAGGDGGLFSPQRNTSSGSDPGVADYPSDGDSGFHHNTSTGNVFAVYNRSATILKVALA